MRREKHSLVLYSVIAFRMHRFVDSLIRRPFDFNSISTPACRVCLAFGNRPCTNLIDFGAKVRVKKRREEKKEKNNRRIIILLALSMDINRSRRNREKLLTDEYNRISFLQIVPSIFSSRKKKGKVALLLPVRRSSSTIHLEHLLNNNK